MALVQNDLGANEIYDTKLQGFLNAEQDWNITQKQMYDCEDWNNGNGIIQ